MNELYYIILKSLLILMASGVSYKHYNKGLIY